MKKEEKNHSWLIPELADKGVSVSVVRYLSGIHPIEEISWSEFVLIWSVQKETFEKTKYFKNRMRPFKKK